MKTSFVLVALLLLAPAAGSAKTAVKHLPSGGPVPAGATAPGAGSAFSAAVLAGDTLYVSGTTDTDRITNKPPEDPKAGAKLVMDNIKRTVEGAGFTMDELTWVQIFASDLSYYAAFNEVYRTYFTGPLPARAFLGAGSLLGGAHFEVMGIAVKSK
jgi:2-iminobutanoate/2-iminopropanoate deaminase